MPFMKMRALDRHLNLLGNFIVTNITVTTNIICEHLSIATTVISDKCIVQAFKALTVKVLEPSFHQNLFADLKL